GAFLEMAPKDSGRPTIDALSLRRTNQMQLPARLQDPIHFLQRLARSLNVFEVVEEHDVIEARVRERECFAVTANEVDGGMRTLRQRNLLCTEINSSKLQT